MKILIDVDALQQAKVLSPELAETLRKHAVRDTGSTAINILLAFGALAVAAGILALNPSPTIGAALGLGFVVIGAFVDKQMHQEWGKLGSIWMVVGALILAGGIGSLINQPLLASLIGAAVLAIVGYIAQSRLLVGLVPVALLAAIGGSTGYWHATYEVTIREPTLTILIFSALAYGAWQFVKHADGIREALGLIFARVCVVIVNFGFWIGSLWGDSPGHYLRMPETWSDGAQRIPDWAFVIGWAAALLAIGVWGARRGRRFIVNTAAVFGAIHLYTQWFERLGLSPVSVIVAGVATVVIGLLLWRYNRAEIVSNI